MNIVLGRQVCETMREAPSHGKLISVPLACQVRRQVTQNSSNVIYKVSIFLDTHIQIYTCIQT